MESNVLAAQYCAAIGGFVEGPSAPDGHAESHHPLRHRASAKPGARLGGNMIGPCDERDATGRGQPVTPTFDPLEPTIDIALKNFGGVRSEYPKVPRTTRTCRQARWPRRAPADDRRSFVASGSNRPRRDPPCGDDAPRRCANAVWRRASASMALAPPPRRPGPRR